MKTTFTYIAIVASLLALVIGLIYRGTRSSSLDAEQAANLFGKGMPPSLMTRAAHMDTDTEEISVMMERIQESMNPSSWLARGGSFRNVVAGDLIEVDEPEGEYTLSMTLLWRDLEISTQRRYFRTYQGADGQIEGRSFEYLGCVMSSRGFFSGSCECSGISSTKVAVDPNWTFDDKENNVKSEFKKSFVAILGSNGRVDCENEATISWRMEDKAAADTGQSQPEQPDK